MKRGFSSKFGLFLMLSVFLGLSVQAKPVEFVDTKKKIATVAIFGAAGAGLGLLTVVSSTDPQSRLGNVTAGLVVGAIVGTVYVLSDDRKQASVIPWLTPTLSGPQAGLLVRF